MKEILNSLVEKTMALGGVAIGIMKAQLAAKTIGKDNWITSYPLLSAKEKIKGRNNKVVAVLLVISVRKDIMIAMTKMIKKIFKLLKKYR